jgi:tetratricopeptide (TPR) repeat protein
MKLNNLSERAKLSAVAIATSILVGAASATTVRMLNSGGTSEQQKVTESVTVGAGIFTGAGILAAYFFYDNRRYRCKLSSESQKSYRYKAEFGCGPITNFDGGIAEVKTQQIASSEVVDIPPSVPETSLTSNSQEVASSADLEKNSLLSNSSEIDSPISDGQTPVVRETDSADKQTEVEVGIPVTPSELCAQAIALIDKIVETGIKGKIRSKEQIYQMLVENITVGTSEIFERCFADRIDATQRQIDKITTSPHLFPKQTAEMQKERLIRTAKILQVIEGEYIRWQKEIRSVEEIAKVTQEILVTPAIDRFMALLQAIDPNQTYVFKFEELQQLSKSLKQAAEEAGEGDRETLESLAAGINNGLKSLQPLYDCLTSWIYEQPTNRQRQLGFHEESTNTREPWATWRQHATSPLLQQLFSDLAGDRSPLESATEPPRSLRAWAELAIVLQGLQRELVAWFEKQPYTSEGGKACSISTFLTFAVIWFQLFCACDRTTSIPESERQQLAKACFQMVLQILRTFAQRAYFPLYGGVFALFSKDYLRDALKYLDVPLQEVAGTQEKARILTLLGYSQHLLGKYEAANSFHEQALEIARIAGDRTCEIANLNHKSRICVSQKNYTEAINYSQKALIFSRQVGDRLGETNALANLGYSEVLSAQQKRVEPEVYETAIEYLKEGLKLSEKLIDCQSQALCCNSLGIAYTVLEQPQTAIQYLNKGTQSARFSGDLCLQGFNFAYLAEAYYAMKNLDQAVINGCLGMYILEQTTARDWRKPAGLMTILEGQIGEAGFQNILRENRPKMMAIIGVDGCDHIPQLLEQYKRSLD